LLSALKEKKDATPALQGSRTIQKLMKVLKEGGEVALNEIPVVPSSGHDIQPLSFAIS
jgi:hypothetical protein